MAMPLAFQIGPLMIAAERALAVVLIAIFLLLASVIARRGHKSAERTGWWALGVGIVAARAWFVGTNWEAFEAEPSAIFAFWQGGFTLIAGLVGALIAIFLTLPSRSAASALGGGALALTTANFAASSLLKPEPVALPTGLALKQWTGDSVALSSFGGRPVVINLWASWCLPCRREMPMLVDAASRSSVPILLVNSGETREAAEGFLRDVKLPSKAVYLDPNATLASATGVNGYPATLFVDAAGQIQSVHVGEISRAMLTNELNAFQRQIR